MFRFLFSVFLVQLPVELGRIVPLESLRDRVQRPGRDLVQTVVVRQVVLDPPVVRVTVDRRLQVDVVLRVVYNLVTKIGIERESIRRLSRF